MRGSRSFCRECPTRRKREANPSESPRKGKPAECSRRSCPSNDRPPFETRRGSQKETENQGNVKESCSEGSSLRLQTPENAVMAPSISVMLEYGTPSTSVAIEGVNRSLIVDTGSSISIMQSGISRTAV